jgi:transcriptional regulator NrdR family protein
MKCPRCGAQSDVLDTRPGPHHTTRRRRECHNDHRFVTLEVLPPATNQRDLAAAARAAMVAAQRWLRDMRIRRDTRPATIVAREHDLTEARVRQIRAEG